MADKGLKKKEHLSYSALGKFERCPRGYWEEFMGNWKDGSSTKALMVGQLFHKYIETLGDEVLIQNWIDEHDNSREFYMKSKPDQMYSDFHKAMNSAQDFIDLELYPEIPSDEQRVKRAKDAVAGIETESPGFFLQEVRLEGNVGKVPFVGVIDLLTIKDGELYIRDWKHVKDFRRVFDENEGRYVDWYQKYIKQQMLYAYLFFNGKASIYNKNLEEEVVVPKIDTDTPIHCEIVGISKGGEISVKRIKFDFKNLEELTDTTTWSLITSSARYAWNKLTTTTEKTKEQLKVCGECPWCKAHHVVIDEKIKID